MNIILLEDSRAPLFTERLVQSFPNSSVVGITKRNNSSILKELSSRPLLSDKWLLLIESNTNEELIKSLFSMDSCICVLKCKDSEKDYFLALSRSRGDTRFVDCKNITEEEAVKRITSKLDTTEQIARMIYTKCNKFMPYIEETIVSLSCLGRAVKMSDLDNYMEKYNSITIYSLYYHILGIDKISNKELVTYLYRYKYAIDYIKKTLLDLFDSTESLYKSIDEGLLGSDNIHEYVKNTKLKVTPYFVTKTVNKIYKSMTYADLVITKIRITKVESIVELLDILVVEDND